MASIPSGTVTFLFTDIEGSTRLWEQSPKEMSAALSRHDALLRQAIEQAGGHVFKTVGDAFCAAFHTPHAAVSAACAAQSAISREAWPVQAPIKVRMGLHTGSVESRDNDYFGQPLNRVARLMSIGHGGQVLASLATQELVRDALPPGASLQDLGEVRLKDLVRPERVFQVKPADVPGRFPALKSLDATRNNLPIQATSFIGREDDMRRAAGLLAGSPLVTLVGPGGAGKTRLALQVAADGCERFAGGTWFVDLSAVTEAPLVAHAIAQALEIREEAGVAIADSLVKRLKEAEATLLVLDNCEHVIEACAALCQRMVNVCPGVKVIATSREAMRVPGEATLQVPPLASPDPSSPVAVDALSQYAAVQLFIDRAVAVRPGFVVDARNAPALASICHRLDGIPLAIELAAARVRSMSVQDIDYRLDKRFHLLTGGARTALPRQQTLRSLVDWSFDLLGPSERAFFLRVAVFAGGWTLKAAESVCSGGDIEEWEVLDLLAALADKSLVLAEERASGTRYRMLETIRQYALEKLQGSGEDGTLRGRHLAYYRDQITRPPVAEDHKAWVDNLQTEAGNWRAALAWALVDDVSGGVQLIARLYGFWFLQGRFREAQGWAAQFSRATGSHSDPGTKAQIHRIAGVFGHMSGDFAEATAGFKAALELARESGDRHEEASALGWLGLIASLEDRFELAYELAGRGLDMMRALGDELGMGGMFNHLGIIADNAGDRELSRKYHEESLQIARKLGNRRFEAATYNCLGRLAADSGDHTAALELCGRSLVMRRDYGILMGISGSFTSMAIAWTTRGDAQRAARLWACAMRLNEEMGLGMSKRERREIDDAIAATRARFDDPAQFDAAWAEGHALSTEAAIEYALEGTGQPAPS